MADQHLDVAIVGGGISGLYAGWRLANSSAFQNKHIAVFEGSNRTGGRLWSVEMQNETAIPAELGGMFFSDAQPFVYNLCTSVFSLPTQQITPRPNFAYIRGSRFKISDLSNAKSLPYKLAPDEQEKPYHELLSLALYRIVPKIGDYWPLKEDADPRETITYLRNFEYSGRPLYRWGFWNLLAKSLSNEAYLCLRDLISSYSMFNNWNAYDAILSVLEELHGNWFRLSKGYEHLAKTISTEMENSGIQIHRNTRLLGIYDNATGDLRLKFDKPAEFGSVSADRVILALPRFAIEALDDDSSIFENRVVPSNLDATDGVSAFKIFMTFNDPWWRQVKDGPGTIEPNSFAASHTDLPMRQCYYLGTDPSTGEGLLLASFGDVAATPFWASLISDSGRQQELRSEVPAIARQEVIRQLSEMHDIEIPEPNSAIFVDWSRPPYGGGWHAWRPGWQSWKVMKILRKPDKQRNFHICGESVCAHQGWVEGALTSAEVLLQEQFGLSMPDWVTSNNTLVPYNG